MRNFGLIGKTLKHSFSASFFNNKFANEGINANYSLFEFDTEKEIATFLKERSFSGLNVTIPYKESIIDLLDGVSEEANLIGAVNCVVIENDKLIGYNTDAFGFRQSIKPFLTNLHERSLILGTGGSSKAVNHVFNSIGINSLFISRNPKVGQFSYADMNVHMINACKVIVNCTPIGMFPNEEEIIDFPYELLSSEHLVIDLIYNPAKTKFLEKAEKAGAQILNGESMLKEQALKSWELWNK